MSDTLIILYPPGYAEERGYVFQVIFEEFLGLGYECRETAGNTAEIRLGHAPEGGVLCWSDVLFQTAPEDWLTTASLPRPPLPVWNASRDLPEARLVEGRIPIIYGSPVGGGTWFTQEGRAIRLGADIAGSVFFMLSCYEKAVLPERDGHGRFPAKGSLAYREGYLDRPIVDEYIEILWACMQRLWPGLKRKERHYRVCLSHDVDHPLGAVDKPWPQVLRSTCGDFVKRRDLGLAYRRFRAKLTGNYHADPLNTFDFIMAVSERHGFRSSFYFKTGSSNSQFDEGYTLASPWMQTLLRRIHERGHEIGLHTSYDAYRDPARTRAEFEALLRVTERLNISQERWGGRQHYLRWENPVTWQVWEGAGLDYDATLGFADHVGFRCGTGHEFPVFNLKAKRALRLSERPLILMEATLLNRQYMGLPPTRALECITRVSRACRLLGGTLTVLWHNSSLLQPWQRRLYLEALEVLQ